MEEEPKPKPKKKWRHSSRHLENQHAYNARKKAAAKKHKEENPEVYEAMEVAGTRLDPTKLKFFQRMVRKKWEESQRQIAEELGISEITASSWKKSPWFAELYSRHVMDARKKFEAELCARSDELIEHFFDIVSGKRSEDRSANAAVGLLRQWMEMGDDPLIKKKPGIAIQNNNTLNTSVTLDVGKLKELNQDDLLSAALSGDLPKDVTGG